MNIVTATCALLGLRFFAVSVRAAETEYCAFEVNVTTSSGTPRPKVPVLLTREHKSMLSEAVSDANGRARLCDAPLEAVDISVGFDVCGLVTILNLHSMWPDTKRIFVTFEDNPCNHFVAAEYCQVLLRVQDDHGRAVVGARFSGKPFRRESGSDVTDHLGRLYHLVKRGDRFEGSVRGAGGANASISVPVTDDLELKVVLRK
jgi:hypothetical protein